jgi:hypothetical protein
VRKNPIVAVGRQGMAFIFELKEAKLTAARPGRPAFATTRASPP